MKRQLHVRRFPLSRPFFFRRSLRLAIIILRHLEQAKPIAGERHHRWVSGRASAPLQPASRCGPREALDRSRVRPSASRTSSRTGG